MNAHDISQERVCRFDPTTLKMGVDVLVESTIEAINPVVEKLMRLLTTNCCPREHEFAVETAAKPLSTRLSTSITAIRTKRFGCAVPVTRRKES
jgi:hypothetical protein